MATETTHTDATQAATDFAKALAMLNGQRERGAHVSPIDIAYAAGWHRVLTASLTRAYHNQSNIEPSQQGGM